MEQTFAINLKPINYFEQGARNACHALIQKAIAYILKNHTYYKWLQYNLLKFGKSEYYT